MHGTAQNVAYTNGQIGLAASFNGSSGNVSSFTTFDYKERTVSLWVFPQNVNGPLQVLMTQDDNSLVSGILRVDVEAGMMTLWAGGTSGTYSFVISDNQWYHLALIRTSTMTRYFVNGVMVYEGIPNGEGSTINPNPYLVIGASRSYTQNYYGLIDEFRIYPRALSEVEVLSLYNF